VSFSKSVQLDGLHAKPDTVCFLSDTAGIELFA
jgi:hypothetical protein